MKGLHGGQGVFHGYLFIVTLCIISTSINTQLVSCITIDSVAVTNPSCFGSSDGSLIPTISGSMGTVVYTWTPCCQVGNNVENAPNGTYNLLVTDDVGTDIWEGHLLEPSPVGINFVQDDAQQCNEMDNLGNPPKLMLNSFYAITANGGTPGYTYLWESDTGSFDDDTDLNTMYTGPSEQVNYVNLTVFDSNGCTTNHSFEVIIDNPYIQADIVPPTTDGGSDGELQNIVVRGIYDSAGVGFFNWELYDTNGPVLLNSGNSLSPIPDETGLSAGTYQLNIVGTCSTTLYIVIPEPIIIDMPTDIFYNDPFTVTITNGAPPLVYSWSPTIGLENPNAKEPNFQFHPDLPTDYTLTVTDNDGFQAQETVQVRQLSLTTSAPIHICDGSPVMLPLTVNDGVGPYTYSWSPTIGLNNPNIANPVASFNEAMAITYTVTVTDSNSVQGQTSIDITIENPSITFETEDITCLNEGSLLNIEVTNSLATCWNLMSEMMMVNSGPLPITDISGLDAGTYTLELDCTFCPFSTNVITFANPVLPTLNVPSSINYCNFNDDNIGIIAGTAGIENIDYSWSPSNLVLNANQRYPNLMFNADLPRDFTLEITDQYGCTDSSVITFSGNTIPYSINVQPVSCDNVENGQITVSGDVTCQWSGNGGNSNECTRSNLAIGTYEVIIIDSCGFVTPRVVDVNMVELIDEDGDNVPNCRDDCPLDGEKVVPGICGCGNPDLDEDGDGYVICNDLCDTDPRIFDRSCDENIQIPSNDDEDDDNSDNEEDNVAIAVSIPQQGIDITYNVSENVNDTNGVDEIEVKALPLSEVNPDGDVVQAIDLNALVWRNSLTKFDGYEVLISTAQQELNGQIVELVYHHFFFRRTCRIEGNSTEYGIANRAIFCDGRELENEYALYNKGDSKLSFTVRNWPFLSSENALQATYKYTSLRGKIENHRFDEGDDVAVVTYNVDTGVQMNVQFLVTSLLDSAISSAKIVRIKSNEVTVRFGYFEGELVYDPSLRFLLYSDDSTDEWITWRIPLIVTGTIVILAVGVGIVYGVSPKVRNVVNGEEYERVANLDDRIKKVRRSRSRHRQSVLKEQNEKNRAESESALSQKENDEVERKLSEESSHVSVDIEDCIESECSTEPIIDSMTEPMDNSDENV